MNLGEKIKEYRIENKLTQKILSERIGIGRTTLAEIEGGRIKGTLQFITKLSEVTGKSLSFWTDGEEIEKNYSTYEALNVLIESMIDTGMIKDDGKLNETAQKLILNVLEKEISLKIKKMKDEK